MKKKTIKIKIRLFWGDVKPYTRIHTSKKGKKGYSRKENKRQEKWDNEI